MIIRPYQPGDVAAMQRICIETGADGQDASTLYERPELLHVIYLDPYLAAAGDLAFVACDDEGVFGYWLGVADSYGFAQWEDEHWWPAMRERYPLTDSAPGSPDARLRTLIATSQAAPDPDVAAYPAELHIDIAARGQGRGTGRALMRAGLTALADRGVPGVHLGVSSANAGAIGFYRKLGFQLLADHGTWQRLVLALPANV